MVGSSPKLSTPTPTPANKRSIVAGCKILGKPQKKFFLVPRPLRGGGGEWYLKNSLYDFIIIKQDDCSQSVSHSATAPASIAEKIGFLARKKK